MLDKTKTSLELFTEETKSLALPSIKAGIKLENVYGRGKLGQVTSFGGQTLAENFKAVDKAFEKSYELQRVYSRNHSEWTRRHMNMQYYDPWHNMRQVSAELSSRRQALQEAKWKHIKAEIKIKEHYEKIKNLPFNEELARLKLEVEIAEMQEGMVAGMSHIEGAMKDVLALEKLYEELRKQILEFDESDFEKHNARAYLRQAISQSLRDIRQCGSITKGEQELLEQIGVNPGKLQELLREYILEEKNSDDFGIVGLKSFIEELAEKLIPAAAVKSELFGFSSTPDTSCMYLEKIKNPSTSEGD